MLARQQKVVEQCKAANAPTLSSQFNDLGDHVIMQLFNVSPKDFKKQAWIAHDHRVSYLSRVNNTSIGVSAVSSIIKPDAEILDKNFIVPRKYFRWDPRLSETYFISSFVNGVVKDGALLYGENDVCIAGWASYADLVAYPSSTQPRTFKSELDVVVMPCTQLRPIDELLSIIQPKEN